MSTSGNKATSPINAVGRGAGVNVPNRFERLHVEPEFLEDADPDDDPRQPRKIPTEFYLDDSKTVVSENDSPDQAFRFSINPYRGCSHGCSYCYARPWHEYLGWSAGLDFETRILVKRDAPVLFRKWLARPSWVCEPVQLSGVTDPYQPAERKFAITRGCIQVALECGQPLHLITKNAMILRDLDLLGEMADRDLVRVILSITSLDQSLTRIMEPQTSSPEARLRAIRALSERGVHVAVMVAPIIPGLTDEEVPAILRAVAENGARSAGYTVVRLNGAVEPVFANWLERHFPDRREKVLNRIRALHDGRLADSRWGTRMRGTGALAETIRCTFKMFAGRYNLCQQSSPVRTDLFQRPRVPAAADFDSRQLRLFD